MYKFVYPYKNIKQLTMDGKDVVIKDISGPGHMMRDDTNTALCGAIKEELEKGADGIISRDVRIANATLCQECQEKWKKLPGSPWRKWAEAINVDR